GGRRHDGTDGTLALGRGKASGEGAHGIRRHAPMVPHRRLRTASGPAPVRWLGPSRSSMTDSPAASAPHVDEPHDHAGHDHPPTGADLVRDLVKGLSIQALLIPALGVVLLVAILPFAPLTPVPLLLGIGLGALQLISLVATSLFVSRTRRQLAVNPGLLAVRSVVEELLRVAAVLLAVLLWPADVRPDLGIWVGAGSALVWLVLATAQTVTTRQRIARPGDWSEEAISTMLAHRVGARSTVLMRLLDVAGTVMFQV